MDKSEFQEALLKIMEAKDHWAWPYFTSGRVSRASLHIHFEQEYETYVRDFPVMIGRAYVQCPIASVRAELAENLFEEETGKLAAGRPHPELFLEYPKGLGMDLDRFSAVQLLPDAQSFRDQLDQWTQGDGWETAAAVTTIFLEGTKFERGELDPNMPKRPVPPLEEHPLVVHYNLPIEALALTKAHRSVEGQHRASAWRCVLDHVSPCHRQRVIDAMSATLVSWKRYRDAVAHACGLSRTE